MKTVLVYDRARFARNSEFVRMIFEKFALRGWKIELKMLEDWTPGADLQGSVHDPLPDAVLMRAADPDFSRNLESLGVRVFNSSLVSEICNDKWKTYEFFSSRGVPMMPTFRIGESTQDPALDYPFILKSPNGHGGSEVLLVRNSLEYKNLAHSAYIAQPLCDTPGKDLRVYCVGNQIAAAMLRTSTTDFRSNYSLGGRAVPKELDLEERTLVEKVLSFVRFDFVGIDLIYHQNHPILNEIEDIVGSRMLYRETKIDILDLFLEHFDREMNR